ncbi:MAG: excinuclease ABC subunit UvrC [Fastidiosipilaceae bacterium]|nr:excinuclease ABC subunit UvrC [Clostridiaceae bacterium]
MAPEKQKHHEFEARLDLVPTSPGVYLMKNAAGSVIYVGKAINLRNRLRSYFGPNPQGNEKVQMMISHIHDFSYLLANNELEALVLESNLIKRYQPFYNILLKDDHDYPYLKITMNELYPRALKAYRIGADVDEGAKYYGPYLAGDLYRALRTLHAIFPMKTCRRVFPRDIGKERPCLNFYIHKCIGPCRGDVSAAAYRKVMQSVCDFLEGRINDLTRDMKAEMEQAAAAWRFEEAAVLRDRIASLEALMTQQIAVSDVNVDCDALGLYRQGLELCVLKLEVRDGKVNGTSTFFLSAEGETDASVLLAFLGQHYPSAAVIPEEILVPIDVDDSEFREMERILWEIRGRKLTLRRPQRGTKRQLLNMAMKNAKEAMRRRDLIKGTGRSTVDESLRMLADLCDLDMPPVRIEAYDISNLGKDDQACGMVVFENGRAKRSAYRRFKIKSQEGQDDYGAMAEVIMRRFTRSPDDMKFGAYPDLILLDGGNNHVSYITKTLKEIDAPPVAVAGIVKDGRHRTRGLALGDGVVAELAQRLGVARGTFAKAHIEPEKLTEYSREQELALLRFLTSIQDEAHRFAGRYSDTLGKKRRLKYRLESIPGIGPGFRKKLMQEFKTIKRISETEPEVLAARVPGLGHQRAQAIYDHFHPPDETSTIKKERNEAE